VSDVGHGKLQLDLGGLHGMSIRAAARDKMRDARYEMRDKTKARIR
jgi:hypothetical protein